MTTFTPEQVLHFARRRDLYTFTRLCFRILLPGETFIPNWHIEAMCYALERVLRGEVKRLIICVPPRSLKSICCSVAFPAFAMGHDPTRKIICASYGDSLAFKHARDFRAVLESQAYKTLFPGTRIAGKDSQEEMTTTQGGFRLATSIGGALTGRGGGILNVDDPMKAQDAASKPARDFVNDRFSGALLSRLDNKNEGAVVVVMQRLHLDDLVGHLLEMGGWEVLALPAIAEEEALIRIGPGKFYHRKRDEVLFPARESREVLEGVKRELGPLGWAAQYQQAPIPLEGNLVKQEWLRFYKEVPERRSGDVVVISWDTALKESETADYSVATVWLIRGDEHYLLDLVRARLAFPALVTVATDMHRRWRPVATVVESKGSGISLIQEMTKARLPVIAFEASVSKVIRMHSQSARFAGGSVYFPEKALWLDDLIAELMVFPDGKHDDMVDSVSQALEWADQERQRSPIRIRRIG